MNLGDFPEDFTTVTCMFTTHQADGAPVAPLSAFEAADVLIYKNGNAAQKTTTNGVTMTSPFDSITGLHCVVIDTSNDTGDGGFWVAGAQYTLVLSPDETVDGVAVAKVIGTFGIELSEVLRPTTPGRQLDVSAGGEAGLDWANIGSPTTAQTLSGTTVKTATDVETDTQDIQSRLPAALVSGRIDASVGAMAANVMTAAAAAADLTTEFQAGLATSSALSTLQTTADAIDAKTTNLPSDPADASVIAARFDTIDTNLATVDTVVDSILVDTAEIGAAGAGLTAITAKTDSLTFTVAGQIDANLQYVNDVQVTGNGQAGTEWGP